MQLRMSSLSGLADSLHALDYRSFQSFCSPSMDSVVSFSGVISPPSPTFTESFQDDMALFHVRPTLILFLISQQHLGPSPSPLFLPSVNSRRPPLENSPEQVGSLSILLFHPAVKFWLLALIHLPSCSLRSPLFFLPFPSHNSLLSGSSLNLRKKFSCLV